MQQNMDDIRACNTLPLSLKLMLQKHEAELYMLNVSQARCFRQLISSSFPEKEPRNLHFVKIELQFYVYSNHQSYRRLQ